MKEIPQERCTAYLIFVVIVSALGGFLYGYHTGIISGALIFLAPIFQLSIVEQGVVVSTILIGGVIGGLFSGTLADRIGRKPTIGLTALLFIIGSLATALAETYSGLLAGRFLSGLGVGVISVAAPLYLAEISPPRFRGAFVSLYQGAVTIGILISLLINYLFAPSQDWRWMFAIGSFPAVLQAIALFYLPETPAWLFKHGRDHHAIHTLAKLRKDTTWRHQIDVMKESASTHKHGSWSALLSPKLRYLLLIGLVLSSFQQLTGINTVIYYAPKIFQQAGVSSATGAILASLGVAIMNVLFTFLSAWLLDRLGRRLLLMIGVVGMAATLALLSLAFFLHSTQTDLIVLLSLMGYVACFAIGLGPVTWVFLSEVYPLKVRGKAMTLAIVANWGFNYLVALTFLDLIVKLKPEGTFLLYAGICILALWFIHRYLPETKGKSLEEIEKALLR